MRYFILFFFILGFKTHATEDLLSLSIGFGKTDPNNESIQSVSASYSRLYELEKKVGSSKWLLGGGLRIYGLRADRFKTHKDHNEVVEDLSSQSINAFIESRLAWEKWFFGANLDLLGTSFGKSSKISGSNANLSLEAFNLFLFGKNDKGSLNSEFYIGYGFDSFSIKGGLSHLVTEFKGNVSGTEEKRQAFSNLLFVALSFPF